MTYQITRGGNTGSGKVSVTSDVVRFFGSELCDGVGDYRWTVSDEALTLESVEPDACPRRAEALEGVPYELLFPPS